MTHFMKVSLYEVLVLCILGDPGADSVGEGMSKQVEKYGKKKSKEWWDEPLGTISYQTTIPNGCRRSGLWLVPENFCVFLPNQRAVGLWVVSCVLTQNDAWISAARHVCLGHSLRLCSRWKVPISAQNLRDFLHTVRENLTGEYTGPFACIITAAYLKVCEFFKTHTNSLMYYLASFGRGLY